jgi:hypothetical protein
MSVYQEILKSGCKKPTIGKKRRLIDCCGSYFVPSRETILGKFVFTQPDLLGEVV